jgi:roundabout, axon guidance receptor 2
VQILEDRSLQIDNVTIEDMGEYSCEADNAVGSITASGLLTVHCEFSSKSIRNNVL